MSEPTEEASPKRVQQSRDEGRVAQSRDAVGAVAVVATLAAFWVTSDELNRAFGVSLRVALEAARGGALGSPSRALGAALSASFAALVPPLAAGAGAVVLVGALLTGFLFSPAAALPKLDRLDPFASLARFAKPRTYVEPLAQLLKGALLLYVGWSAVRALLPQLLGAPRGTLRSFGAVLSESLRAPLFRMAAVLALLAGLDVLYRVWQHAQDLRMSKDELKREHKESEGDPHLKGERERIHHEMLQEASLERVKKASFVVTNPTHYAAALGWDPDEMDAPELYAKGENAFAQRIIAEAHRAGIPVLRAAPLARALHEAETGEPIPEALYEAVAAVLNYLSQGGDPERFEPAEGDEG